MAISKVLFIDLIRLDCLCQLQLQPVPAPAQARVHPTPLVPVEEALREARLRIFIAEIRLFRIGTFRFRLCQVGVFREKDGFVW